MADPVQWTCEEDVEHGFNKWTVCGRPAKAYVVRNGTRLNLCGLHARAYERRNRLTRKPVRIEDGQA